MSKINFIIETLRHTAHCLDHNCLQHCFLYPMPVLCFMVVWWLCVLQLPFGRYLAARCHVSIRADWNLFIHSLSKQALTDYLANFPVVRFIDFACSVTVSK